MTQLPIHGIGSAACKGCLSGPMEDCYPPENWCEAQSENFLTEEVCYRYEER